MILNTHYILDPMTCGSAYERLSFYTLNESIAHWGGAIQMHLMDSPLGTSEVEQYFALNDSIAIVMMVDVEMDLMNYLCECEGLATFYEVPRLLL